MNGAPQEPEPGYNQNEGEGRAEMFLGEATGEELPWKEQLLGLLEQQLSDQDYRAATETLLARWGGFPTVGRRVGTRDINPSPH